MKYFFTFCEIYLPIFCPTSSFTAAACNKEKNKNKPRNYTQVIKILIKMSRRYGNGVGVGRSKTHCAIS